MRKEVIVTAKTIEQAIELGAKELEMKIEDVTPEVLELPKKGFLGIGATGYKVKILGKISKLDTAVGFLEKMIGYMKINAVPKIISETEDEIKIEIVGEGLGTLIGYHGEILDALQYLTYLAVNKDEAEESEVETAAEGKGKKAGVIKISIDIENYRKKREETLRSLAKKMAERVQKYGRPVTLEPMSPHERRVIHSAIQEMEGVNTHSVGQETERRIVISKEGMAAGAGFSPLGQKRPKSPYVPDKSKGKFMDKNLKKF
ncbi:MAG: protein jag [Oscillospiraceae bacterium]|nr:protein jag [Oscillospiraceae bacterium]